MVLGLEFICILALEEEFVCALAPETEPVCILAPGVESVCALASDEAKSVCVLASEMEFVCGSKFTLDRSLGPAFACGFCKFCGECVALRCSFKFRPCRFCGGCAASIQSRRLSKSASALRFDGGFAAPSRALGYTLCVSCSLHGLFCKFLFDTPCSSPRASSSCVAHSLGAALELACPACAPKSKILKFSKCDLLAKFDPVCKLEPGSVFEREFKLAKSKSVFEQELMPACELKFKSPLVCASLLACSPPLLPCKRADKAAASLCP